MTPPRLILYTRHGCHLCEEARERIGRLRSTGAAFELQLVDVDSDPALAARYGAEVPVLTVNDRKFAKYRIDEARLRRRLAQESG